MSRPAPTVRLVPLGGLGEVGMNCLGLEIEDEVFALDCGVTFPDRTFGADVCHARFDWLIERAERMRALLITHGHEDHIGAVPYLLREIPVPVYAPPYAIELIKKRCEEVRLAETPDLRPIRPGRSFGVGRIEVEPFRVHHSIPDAMGLVLRTPAGTIVHTGDFKIEDDPSTGQIFDRSILERAARDGVRLLLSDSTNVDVEGTSGSERIVSAGLRRLVLEARERVVVATFASNVHRLGALLSLARETGRRLCLLGRSVQAHARIAEELGFVPELSRHLVPPDRARRVPRSELLVVATGSQGEEAAALARLARDAHPDLDLDPGDTVILSSRVIPGSERTVFELTNQLERNGVLVHHRHTDPDVHVSGHACRDEQRAMIRLVRPRAFLPVHGTYHHLSKHAALAREEGIGETLVVENGAIVEVDEDGMTVVGHTTTGRVHVARGEVVPDEVLKDRTLLAELGIVFAAVPVGRDVRRIGMPELASRGFLGIEEEDALLREGARYVAWDLRARRAELDTEEDVRTRTVRAVKRFFADRLGRKPLVMAVVVPMRDEERGR